MQKVILYYTNNQLHSGIMTACQQALLKAAGDIPIVCVGQQPMEFGAVNIDMGPLKKERRSITFQMYHGLLAAWQKFQPDVVFTAEHDVMYPEGYFDFTPSKPEIYYYCTNKYYMTDCCFVQSDHPTLSTLSCDFKHLLSHVTVRLYRTDKLHKKKGGWAAIEPGRYTDNYMGELEFVPRDRPHIDIRHDGNLSQVFFNTYPREQMHQQTPYWGDHTKLKEQLKWT